ncbi:ribose-phosphate diphosphokinase [Patescibacteria group bacterium]
MITLIPTSSAEHLAKLIESENGYSIVYPDKNKDGSRYFPDGEIYTRLSTRDDISGKVIVLHAGSPDPSRGLIELEMLLEILKKSNADSIEIFFTYLPYSMQDKEFHIGDTNAAENIFRKLISYYGIKKIFTIDLHCAGRLWVTNYPIINVSANVLLKQAALNDYPDAVFVTPDGGHERRIGVKGTKKRRLHSFDSEMSSDNEFRTLVKGKSVGVIDDNLETGGTLVRFYEECIQCGAKDIFALITHGLLDDGIATISNIFSKLYLSNAVNRKESNVDISSLILSTISKHHEV